MEGEKETERKRKNQKKYQESQGGEKGFKTRGWAAVPEAEHMRKAENGEAPAGAGWQRTHWLAPKSECAREEAEASGDRRPEMTWLRLVPGNH